MTTERAVEGEVLTAVAWFQPVAVLYVFMVSVLMTLPEEFLQRSCNLYVNESEVEGILVQPEKV